MWFNNLDNRSGLNGNIRNLHYDDRLREIAQEVRTNIIMNSYKNLYEKIISLENLYLAYLKARKNKSKKLYILEFEKDLFNNLNQLRGELLLHSYQPKPLVTFILRDSKTRKISKAHFRDRIIHHAICNIIEPLFEKSFIYDSCANIKRKGNLFAIKRFSKFQRKVTKNLSSYSYCLKADIKHYFQEVNHDILMNLIKRRIKDAKVIWLIKKIIKNISMGDHEKGMPLGNLTSQFFANVYLNELDYFVKHKLKAKYYIRYVDDFVILHQSKEQLKSWKEQIAEFLNKELKLELHPDKSKIIPLSRGIDFVGFRNFYHFKLLRKRNIRNIKLKIQQYKENKITKSKFFEIYQGWSAYAKWADSSNLREKILKRINLKQTPIQSHQS